MSGIDYIPDGDSVPSGDGPVPPGDELVRRLRALEWPEVRSEVAERCWEEFTRRLETGDDETAGPARSDRNVGRQLDFTRRSVPSPRRFTGSPYTRTPALAGRAAVRTPALTR
jgi:hypothetical protein